MSNISGWLPPPPNIIRQNDIFAARQHLREIRQHKRNSYAVLSVLQVVDPVAAAQPAARSKDLMRAMKEAAQGMRGGREVCVGLYCGCLH